MGDVLSGRSDIESRQKKKAGNSRVSSRAAGLWPPFSEYEFLRRGCDTVQEREQLVHPACKLGDSRSVSRSCHHTSMEPPWVVPPSWAGNHGDDDVVGVADTEAPPQRAEVHSTASVGTVVGNAVVAPPQRAEARTSADHRSTVDRHSTDAMRAPHCLQHHRG